MNNIFGSSRSMEVFCMNLVNDWVDYQQSRGLSYTESDFMNWLDDFYENMADAYYDIF